MFGLRAVLAEGGALSLAHSRISEYEGPGLDLNSQTTAISILDCDIDANAGVAIDNARISILVGLDGNRASGNLQGDAVRGSLLPVAGNEEILARNLLNGTLRVPGGADLLVLNGASLTLRKGVILNWKSPGALEVFGPLNALGTGAPPVVLTSIADDEFGADAAGDGQTTGTPGETRGLRMRVESSGTLKHLRVRFAGALNAAAVLVESPTTTVRSVRADRSGFSGIRLFDLNSPTVNLIADNDAQQGILLEGGAADILHATSVNNGIDGNDGISRNAFYTSVVRNSISWNNAADLASFASTAEITGPPASNAPTGANNQTSDPLFVDAAAGDLSLDPLSPAIDAGDPAIAILVGSDHLEAPRLLSATGGASLPDLGALENARWQIGFEGEEAIAEVLDFTVTGDPGLALFAYGAPGGGTVIDPFGVLLIDPQVLKQLQFVPVGSLYSVPVPNDPVFVGFNVGIQAFVVDTLNPSSHS